MCGLEKSTHLAWGLEIKGDAVSGLLAKAEQMLPVVRVFANDLGDQALQRIRPPGGDLKTGTSGQVHLHGGRGSAAQRSHGYFNPIAGIARQTREVLIDAPSFRGPRAHRRVEKAGPPIGQAVFHAGCQGSATPLQPVRLVRCHHRREGGSRPA